jgi:hypothetical protein
MITLTARLAMLMMSGALCLHVTTSTARADIVFASGGSEFGSENVLALNDQSGNTVFGSTSNPIFGVSFTSTTTLSTQSAGQAKFIGPFSDLIIMPTDVSFGFADISFNAFNIGGDGTGNVTVDGLNQFGVTETEVFSVGPGQNFIRLTGTEGQIITKVTLSSTNAIGDLRQVRIEGAEITNSDVVPEPSSMILLASGLIGVVGVARKRVKA